MIRRNMVVIGGGTAGLVTTGFSSRLGAKVALIERHKLGGDCKFDARGELPAANLSFRSEHRLRT